MIKKIERILADIKTWTLVFIFLIIFFNAITAQEPNQNKQNEKYLKNFILCNEILEKNPLSETGHFSIQDEKVIAWFQFSYKSSEDFLLHWEWINPEGKLYHHGELEMKAGDYENYRTWYWINIKNGQASNLLGEWKVKIYINDMFLAEKTFYIINQEKPADTVS